jgi:hypothetical protein
MSLMLLIILIHCFSEVTFSNKAIVVAVVLRYYVIDVVWAMS